MTSLIPTPLKEVHLYLGAQMGEFAGWEVASVYSNSIEESEAVRKDVGAFDVSHMGRIMIEGKDAQNLLDLIITKNVKKLDIGRIIIPAAILNDKAGFIDDVSLFRIKEESYLLVCNAINREKVKKWIEEKSKEFKLNVMVKDITLETTMIAVQGRSIGRIEELNLDIDKESFLQNIKLFDAKVKIISRSGWTGEEGYEIITDVENGRKLWKKLVEIKIKPCGIIARDILRLEAGFLLYGNEINENTNPVMARYWIFSLKKENFIGKKEIERILNEGVEEQRIGLVMKEKGPIPRHGNEIYSINKKIGYITSGGYSPTLNKGIAMGYVKSTHALLGRTVYVEIRNKLYEAKIVEPPFFHK